MAKKYTNPSGFPENLPQEQIVEEKIKASMRATYEKYGYAPLETPTIEYMDTLASKGEIGKEIYKIGRALAEGDGEESDRGLRFDLTVPLARYVSQHFNDLKFPFKRYQIQRVFRGDRPQKGRFREFYQADIDVISNGDLPLHFDAEVVEVMFKLLESLEVGSFTIFVNNRKFLQGLLESFSIGADKTADALRIIDKSEKVPREVTLKSLTEELGLSSKEAEKLFTLLEATTSLDEITAGNALMEEGLTELKSVFANLKHLNKSAGKVVFNPKIARGLDYYTGSVYETHLDGYEKYGSICSGGRYANLAEQFGNKSLPGVGISLGLSRLFEIIKAENLLSFSKKSVTKVLIGLFGEEQREGANEAASQLRANGINTEIYHNGGKKIGDQIKSAVDKGIEYFLILESDGTFTLKNLETQVQEKLKTSLEVAIHISSL